MTDVTELTRKINLQPSCMARVNWKTETDNFKYRRMRAIIMRIENDEVCKVLCEYIINGCCKIPHKDAKIITVMLDDCLKQRKVKQESEHRKQELDEKARNLDKVNSANGNTEIAYEPLACDNLFSNHYYQEYHRLKKENEQLKESLANSSQSDIRQARVEGIRTVVEQLIVYGEKFPSNQNDKAEIIKEALLAKSFNGHIPIDALSSEWKTRLMNLGRKEVGIALQAESMFKISGNDQVNIGGNNGQ